MRKLDFPRLRAWDQCPLCGNAKPRGGLCCWECFNSRGIDVGDADPWAEARFACAELALESAGITLANKLRSIAHGKTCRCCDSLALPGEELCKHHAWDQVRADHYRSATR